MNGHQPFVYISTCGCVFTQAGLKTVSTSSSSGSSSSSSSPKPNNETDPAESEKAKKEGRLSLCPQCATKYSSPEDVRLLNPTPEEEEIMYLAMERARALEPEKKKGKKRKNKEGEEASSDQPPAKKPDTRPSMNPTVAATSNALKSSLAMEEAKRKAGMSEAVKSIYGPKDGVQRKETFMTMGTFTRVCSIFF
jgi:hypothetical protein